MNISSLFHARQRVSRGKAWLAGSAVVALSVAGVAIADSSTGSTSTVSGTFIATTITDKNVQTCTGTDGTYELTHATYSGTATSSDPNLNGALKIEVKSVYNTTKNLGWVDANVRIDGSISGNDARGELSAVNVNGTLQGFLSGHEHGHGMKVLANVTAAFTSAGGFASGSIGTGAATNTAIVTSGSCRPSKSDHNDGDDDDNGQHGDKGHHGDNGNSHGHKLGLNHK